MKKASKAKTKPRAKRPPPIDVLVAAALDELASVDRRNAAAIARVLGELLALLATHLSTDAIDEAQRRTLARRVKAARRTMLGRRLKARAPKRPAVEVTRIVMVEAAPHAATRPPSEVPPASSTAELAAAPPSQPNAGWLPKTLDAAGVVEGHEPTTVVLGLLREALASATTKRPDPTTTDEATPAVRPLSVVLADLFGAFGLSRSQAEPPRSDEG